MELVGPGLDRRIQYRCTRAPVFCAEIRGFDLKFLNRVNRRKHNEIGAIEKIDRVRIVIDAVEHVIVLRWPISVGGKSSTRCVSTRVGLRSIYSCGKLGQE